MSEDETTENVEKTQVVGKPFEVGNPGGPGRPKLTPEKKAERKAVKELVAEYRHSLAEALPHLSPVLVRKAGTGDVSAIKELNDRVMGKAPLDITSGGEKLPTPLLYAIRDNPSRTEALPPPEAD
jgi:hypothetical protein